MAPVLVVLLYALVSTHSRGALFALVVTMGGLWVVKRFHPAFTVTFGAITIVTLGFVFLGFGLLSNASGLGLQSGTPLADFVLRGHREESLFTLTGRTELWSDMFELIVDKPIFGHGYLSTRVILRQMRDWSAYAHNGIMQTLFDLGLVGILVLWYPVVRTVWGCLRYSYEAPMSQRGYHMFMLGTMVYVLLYSIINESFSGVPSYDQVVAFTCVLAYERMFYERHAGITTGEIGYARS